MVKKRRAPLEEKNEKGRVKNLFNGKKVKKG